MSRKRIKFNNINYNNDNDNDDKIFDFNKNKRQQSTKIDNSLKLKLINPLTINQQKVYNSYYNNKNLLLIGSAGTGKSFLSIYLSLKEILNEDSKYKKLIIIRSAVPARDIGFLPGNQKDKMKVYELPYKQIFSDLFTRGDSYDILTKKDKVEFECTSFLRGTTFNNSIIIFDECQNANYSELYTIITRIGQNCKIIFSGDYKQSDIKQKFKDDDSKKDILKFIEIIKMMKSFDIIEFNYNDICRSEIVKEFIINEEKLNF